jgi:hypothetical protein
VLNTIFKKSQLITAILFIFLLSACGQDTARQQPLFSIGANQWNQSDWSAGEGPSTTNQFFSASDINTVVPGQFRLAALSDWFDVNWKYRQLITLTNNVTAQTDYPVRMIVSYQPGMQADFDDLRFTNNSGAKLNYWVHEKTDSVEAEVWVKVDNLNLGNTTIYMYFGNEEASSESDGDNTFMFFDGFDGSALDPAKWTEVDPDGSISVTGGNLVFVRTAGGAWNATVYGNQTYTRSDILFEFDYQWVNNNPSWDAIMFGWHDSGTGISYTDLVYGYYNSGTGGASTVPVNVYEDGVGRAGVAGQWTVTTDYDVRVWMRAGGGAYYEQSEDGGESWLLSYTSAYSMESNLRPAWAFHSGTHRFDNARIRKWMDEEPSAAFGIIEERYTQSGTLISSVFETNLEGSIWGPLSYTVTGAGTTEVKVRTSNDPAMAGSPDFSLCKVIESGTDLASDNCVQDGHRYIQYFVRLIASEDAGTPVFEDINILFEDMAVIANAGPDLTMNAGKTVKIDGSASSGVDLSYHWAIVKGGGSLQDIQSSTPTYIAHKPLTNEDVEILLTVRNAYGSTDSDSVIIHVIPDKAGEEDSSGIVGQVGGTPVYKHVEDGRFVLTAGSVDIPLPENSFEYTLLLTSQNYVVAGVPDANDSAGKVFLAKDDGTIREISGNQPGDRLGEYLSAGDVNGDGIDELLIGAPGAADFGMVYIYDLEFNLIGTLVGTNNYPLNSIFVSNYLAASSSGVIFGGGNPSQNQVIDSHPFKEIDPISFAFMLASRYYFEGASVLDAAVVEATAGSGSQYQTVMIADLLGDGIDDLLLASNDGKIYIYFDRQPIGSNLTSSDANVVISGESGADLFGYAMAAGDVSGDGVIDLVVGAPKYGSNQEGAVFVIFGKQVWDSYIDVTTNGMILKLATGGSNDTIGEKLFLVDTDGNGVNEIYTRRGGGGITVKFDLTKDNNNSGGGCSLYFNGNSGEEIPVIILFISLLLSTAAALHIRMYKEYRRVKIKKI